MTKATDNSTPSISRRDAVNLLVGAAGAGGFAFAAGGANAGTADPVFAMIERHRAELANYETCDAAVQAGHAQAYPVLPIPPDVAHTPEIAKYNALCDALDEASGNLFRAERALVETEPTTVAGAVALLRYLAEFEQLTTVAWAINDGIKEWSAEDARIKLPLTVASALSKIAARSAGSVS
jgi:hypothetical protein